MFSKVFLIEIIKNKDKLQTYDEIHINAKKLANKMVEDLGDLEHIKNELVQENLIKEGLVNKRGTYDKELEH